MRGPAGEAGEGRGDVVWGGGGLFWGRGKDGDGAEGEYTPVETDSVVYWASLIAAVHY